MMRHYQLPLFTTNSSTNSHSMISIIPRNIQIAITQILLNHDRIAHNYPGSVSRVECLILNIQYTFD